MSHFLFISRFLLFLNFSLPYLIFLSLLSQSLVGTTSDLGFKLLVDLDLPLIAALDPDLMVPGQVPAEDGHAGQGREAGHWHEGKDVRLALGSLVVGRELIVGDELLE
jgi:hypothetical protein